MSHARKRPGDGALDESAPTLIDWAKAFASDHASFKYILPTLLLFELILGIVIIKYVKYTEIDWIAYMQEVKGVLDGDLNYANLRGDTGPLVYPAGFVYVYMALYHLTDAGTNILRAQYIFLGVYLLITAAAAVVLHRTCVVPPYAICLISVSKRIHSIFLLRCFNDGIAMLLLYVAVLLFLSNRWSLGCFAFSAAVSIKMNVLLFAPGLLLLLWQRFGFFGAIPKLAICASLQLLLGAPFLLTFPQQYIHGAFDFGRVFQYVWTVNLRFLPEPVFVSKQLALGLLATQLVILAAFFSIRERRSGGISGVFMRALRGPATPAFAPAGKRAPADGAASQNLSPAWIVSGLFVSNFIGIVCARSLHYQFYVWYFHTIPFLLWRTSLPMTLRIVAALIIERAWNTFPATSLSSLSLLGVHALILYHQFAAELREPLPLVDAPNVARRAVSESGVHFRIEVANARAQRVRDRNARVD